MKTLTITSLRVNELVTKLRKAGKLEDFFARITKQQVEMIKQKILADGYSVANNFIGKAYNISGTSVATIIKEAYHVGVNLLEDEKEISVYDGEEPRDDIAEIKVSIMGLNYHLANIYEILKENFDSDIPLALNGKNTGLRVKEKDICVREEDKGRVAQAFAGVSGYFTD